MVNTNTKNLVEIFKVLDRENLLDKVIIIGSWAVYFYSMIYPNFSINIRTVDIDFYVPFPTNFKQKYSLVLSLKKINYDLRQDTLTQKDVFISPDQFELEFLTGLNRNELNVVTLGNTQIHAESLRYLDLFNRHYIDFKFEGLVVKVASPAAYVTQKLLILHQRKTKIEKDVEAIKATLQYIHQDPLLSQEMKSIFNRLSLKTKKRILHNSNQFGIDFIALV